MRISIILILAVIGITTAIKANPSDDKTAEMIKEGIAMAHQNTRDVGKEWLDESNKRMDGAIQAAKNAASSGAVYGGDSLIVIPKGGNSGVVYGPDGKMSGVNVVRP